MGIFDKLFGSSPKSEKKALPWQKLETVAQLDTIKKRSFEKPQVIFKHSTRCGISSMVIRQFEGNYDFDPEEVDLYYLDLLSYRDVSQEIASKFQVIHQSPQLLIIHKGQTVHHASHHSIHPQHIAEFV